MVGRTAGHTHASCNAVTLVWGSLRLAPTILASAAHAAIMTEDS